MLRTFILRTEQNATALYAFLKQNWRHLADQQEPLCVTVSCHKRKRSVEQNKRYWKVLNEIASQAWVDGKQFGAEAWHEYFKRELIGLEDLPGGGVCGISTTTLNVSDFCDYMTKVEACAATDLGVEIMI